MERCGGPQRPSYRWLPSGVLGWPNSQGGPSYRSGGCRLHERPRGQMTTRCPRCGATSQVRDSRHVSGTTRRKRICLNKKCRAFWTTIEMRTSLRLIQLNTMSPESFAFPQEPLLSSVTIAKGRLILSKWERLKRSPIIFLAPTNARTQYLEKE